MFSICLSNKTNQLQLFEISMSIRQQNGSKYKFISILEQNLKQYIHIHTYTYILSIIKNQVRIIRYKSCAFLYQVKQFQLFAVNGLECFYIYMYKYNYINVFVWVKYIYVYVVIIFVLLQTIKKENRILWPQEKHKNVRVFRL